MKYSIPDENGMRAITGGRGTPAEIAVRMQRSLEPQQTFQFVILVVDNDAEMSYDKGWAETDEEQKTMLEKAISAWLDYNARSNPLAPSPEEVEKVKAHNDILEGLKGDFGRIPWPNNIIFLHKDHECQSKPR